jgi:hypothetical protein
MISKSIITMIAMLVLCPIARPQGVVATVNGLVSLSLDGAYPLYPGEYACVCGHPTALTLDFSPQVTDYALLLAPWANPEIGPWQILTVAPVPGWGNVSFAATPPAIMSGYSFLLLAVTKVDSGALVVLPPVGLHFTSSPPVGP